MNNLSTTIEVYNVVNKFFLGQSVPLNSSKCHNIIKKNNKLTAFFFFFFANTGTQTQLHQNVHTHSYLTIKMKQQLNFFFFLNWILAMFIKLFDYLFELHTIS